MNLRKPHVIVILRAIGILAAVVFCGGAVGGYRMTGFGFEMEVIWAQLFMSLVFTAPLCLLACTGWSWFRKTALVVLMTFAGISLSHVHAAVQEAGLLRQYGQHPGARVIVHRWFPYGRHTVTYEPEIGWLGDD